MVGARHEFVDHTSELTIRAWAGSFDELLSEMTRAFVELVPVAIRGEADERWRELPLDGSDRVALLVDWLNELVYGAEVLQWVPIETRVERVEEDERGEHAISIHARGVRLEEPFVFVKAATLHGAFVREDAEGIEAEVTLDV